MLIVLLFFCLHMLHFPSCTSDAAHVSHVGCVDTERQALLKFKQGLTDLAGRLSSWKGKDCCTWTGIRCNNRTGHIVKLDLHNPITRANISTIEHQIAYANASLGGEISPSLLHLKHLHYLDLSNNDFDGINIPKFIGSLKELRHLDLSNSFFNGPIPPHLGNLSNLHYLNLDSFSASLYEMEHLTIDSLQWLSGLPSLSYLNLNKANLSRAATDWLEHVNRLPALLELHLDGCELYNLPSSLPFVNFTSLEVLRLRLNGFSSSMPLWLMKLKNLASLDFSDNRLRGSIPDALGLTMTSLQFVDLGWNHIQGKIPRSFGNLCNLKEITLRVNNVSGEITEFLDGLSTCPNKSLERIDLNTNQFTGVLPNSLRSFKSLVSLKLHSNRMNGTVPEGLGELSQLAYLDLSDNFFEGVLSESHFANLTKLEELAISSKSAKSLVLNVSSNWIAPFSGLHSLDMNNCQLGPLFPSWIEAQKHLSVLSLKNAGISDTLPIWFGNLSQLRSLDLSNNQIRGRIPTKFHHEPHANFSLKSSSLNGPFLPLFPYMEDLILRGNLFSGSIPSDIGKAMPRLQHLDLSMNLMNGRIPSSICQLTGLRALVLSDNGLMGEIPQLCWKDLQNLLFVDLANNKLTGKVPNSLIFLHSLKHLKLSNNKFSGELPFSYGNHSELITMDVGENNLSGRIPTWIGNGLPLLKILRLHSNHFIGGIPSQLCGLSSLNVLDLGQNELSGAIPRCFGNLSAMTMVGISEDDGTDFGIRFGWALVYNKFAIDASVTIVKGRELNYSRNLGLLKIVDLSKNNLFGEIPQELTKLIGLSILNLSMNHFSGRIPEKIGKLEQLETLDLSQNQLSGPIPPSITSLNFLSRLNLAYNNLSGKIPSSNQLQTLNDQSSIYEGNPELCGPLLANKCERYEAVEDPPSKSGNEEEDDQDEVFVLSFYASMGLGFVIGFWGVCGTLVLKRSWRHSFFQFIDGIKDRVFVVIIVKMARIKA